MRQKEIFEQLATAAMKSVDQIASWKKAVLRIKRLEGVVGFESFYETNKGEIAPIDTQTTYFDAKAVHELYEITTTQFPVHADWNRAVFTLYPDKKFEIEYIWDQELQNELDSYAK